MGASEEDVEKIADRFEREADDLQRRSDDVAEHTETTRQEWERKRSDPSVPGAVPPDDGEPDAEPSGDEPDEDASA